MPRFRGRTPRRGPLPFRYVLLLSTVFFIFSTVAGLWIVNNGIKPTLVSIAESETREIATEVINNAFKKQIEQGIDKENLIKINETDTVSYMDINSEIITNIQANLQEAVQKEITEAANGNLSTLVEGKSDNNGIVYHIPLGQATNNALLGNLGPEIPVRFYVVGDVSTNPVYDIEKWGINNAVFRLDILIKVNIEVVIPFATRTTSVETKYNIVTTTINGKVPEFYNNGGESSPSIELPTGR